MLLQALEVGCYKKNIYKKSVPHNTSDKNTHKEYLSPSVPIKPMNKVISLVGKKKKKNIQRGLHLSTCLPLTLESSVCKLRFTSTLPHNVFKHNQGVSLVM